jgi:hypothetical protein
MNAEVLSLLETAFNAQEAVPDDPPVPFKGKFLITDEWLRWAKEEGRS